MGKAYDFLSKWTKIDELLAPYNSEIFERIAASYGRRIMAFIAAVALLMLCLGIAVTSYIGVSGLQRVYLAAAGIETQAAVLDVVLDPPTRRGSSEWATVKYVFQAGNGESISDSIRRPPWEAADVVPGKRIELLYAEQFPRINLPRIGFRNSGYLAFLGLLSLAFSVHFALFLMKYRTWRRRPVPARVQL